MNMAAAALKSMWTQKEITRRLRFMRRRAYGDVIREWVRSWSHHTMYRAGTALGTLTFALVLGIAILFGPPAEIPGQPIIMALAKEDGASKDYVDARDSSLSDRVVEQGHRIDSLEVKADTATRIMLGQKEDISIIRNTGEMVLKFVAFIAAALVAGFASRIPMALKALAGKVK